MYIYVYIYIYIYIFVQEKYITYIHTALGYTYLLYNLQVNIEFTQIFNDDILTILP